MILNYQESSFIFSFDLISTVAIGLISLYLGRYLKKKSLFFNKFGIPSPVIGGLLFAIIHLLLRINNIGEIQYNTTLQEPFMLVFFTTIGLSSSVSALKKGGKLLIIFWLLSGFLSFIQGVIGVSIAKLTGISPLLGILAGPVSMTGGHGSASAFGTTVENLGVIGASAMALSSATFGLVAGGLLGSPLAYSLIKKYDLKPKGEIIKDNQSIKDKAFVNTLTSDSLILHILMLSVIMSIGISISYVLKTKYNLALPSYVGAMFIAVIFNNLNNKKKLITIDRPLISIIGEVSLNIFLSMALISLKLWELSDLAVPMILILLGQVLFIWLYTRYIVFNLIGKDYDAAVMVSGMCGSGLGATSNAMINMGEVSGKFGYTVNPYLIVPLTGAFLIDLFQMPVIIAGINLFK